MVSRRHVLGATGLALAGSSAGCLDMLPFVGNDPIEFDATAASIPESTRQETGYEQHRVREVVVERSYTVAGQTQDVVVTNQQAEYDKAVDLGAVGVPTDQRLQAAVFTVLSTPQVSVLGETFNPVADMSPEELAGMIQDRYDGLSDLQHVGDEAGMVAGQSTRVGEFEGEAELVEAGMTIDLTLHIAEAVESGDDLLVAIGGYPRMLQAQERPHIGTLMNAITHPA